MWWGNDRMHSQASTGWLAAGYIVEDVSFKDETVVFRKATVWRAEGIIFGLCYLFWSLKVQLFLTGVVELLRLRTRLCFCSQVFLR